MLPFADLRDLGALLQRAGFALPVADVDRVVVRYGDAFALMQDLRRMGATNVLAERRRTPLRRATLLRMAQIYAERFADADGRIRATFDIVWLSGWAPHESQQQPLKPGSAKASLADAVKGRREPTLILMVRSARSSASRTQADTMPQGRPSRRPLRDLLRMRLRSTNLQMRDQRQCPPAASGSRAVFSARTQASFWPSRAVTSPSQRRQI